MTLIRFPVICNIVRDSDNSHKSTFDYSSSYRKYIGKIKTFLYEIHKDMLLREYI